MRVIQTIFEEFERACIAGKDIPAGSYIYTCLASGEDWGNVTIYSEKGEGDQQFWEVAGVPFSLTIYAGVMFK